MFKLSKSIPFIFASLLSVSIAFAVHAEQTIKETATVASPELDKILLEALRTSKKFDSDLWLHEKNQISRVTMVPDLIRSNALIGMERSKVHQLLGDPTSPTQYTEPATESYFLPCGGSKCGWAPLERYLEFLYLDDRVERFRLRQIDPLSLSQKITTSQWVEKNLKW
jgi:hypothetical protein